MDDIDDDDVVYDDEDDEEDFVLEESPQPTRRQVKMSSGTDVLTLNRAWVVPLQGSGLALRCLGLCFLWRSTGQALWVSTSDAATQQSGLVGAFEVQQDRVCGCHAQEPVPFKQFFTLELSCLRKQGLRLTM